MQLPPERPLALVLSFALIRAVALIVPAIQRADFRAGWQWKLLRRWEFLFHTGLWNPREALALVAHSALAVPDAAQHLVSQEPVVRRVRQVIQSPLTCLGILASLMVIITIVSGGLPATRDLFFRQMDHGNSKLVYVWVHNIRGGGDRPLPSDAIDAWRVHSKVVEVAAAFHAVRRDVQIDKGPAARRLVVATEPAFFRAMDTKPVAGAIASSTAVAVLSYDAWAHWFHASPRVLGRTITVAGTHYPVSAILPAGFKPLSRQPALYLVHPRFPEQDAYAVLKVNSGITQKVLNRDLTGVAQNFTYYFLQGQIRYAFAQSEIWTPVRSFATAVAASALTLLMVFRVKWGSLLPDAKQDKAYALRTSFFAAKTALGLLCVFTACLEWSRSSSAILFGNFDPASGPFLLWLYILGAMGVLFWTAFDQNARCRECLQLLAFPVRMGSPGTLLLDWSGIELCCSRGHGVLHVPHLAPSWAEESDHWIGLDESWQSLFGRKQGRDGKMKLL